MNKNVDSSGFDLYEISENEWILHVKSVHGAIYTGSFKKVVKLAVLKLGFKLSEIEVAVSEMLKMDHNGAHFGMYRGFIFTFSKEFKNVNELKKVG